MCYFLVVHSINKPDNQKPARTSFIEAARRAQIVEAAIATLAELGYTRASFAQIARRAGITPSLISYHFADKEALLTQTLETISGAWDRHIAERVAAESGAPARLRAYIEASLTYMGTRPDQFAALVEIAFNARTPDGTLLYRSDEEEPGLALLKGVLADGQAAGDFRPFDTHAMAVAIRGAISEFFGEMHKPGRSLPQFTAALVELFARATAA
jgi:AcrR family transcriptional regulator